MDGVLVSTISGGRFKARTHMPWGSYWMAGTWESLTDSSQSFMRRLPQVFYRLFNEVPLSRREDVFFRVRLFF